MFNAWVGVFSIFIAGAAGSQMSGGAKANDAVAPLALSGGVLASHLLHRVAPECPYENRMKHLSCMAILRVEIGRDGSVEKIEVLRTTSDAMRDAVVAAVRQWRYAPFSQDGKPVAVLSTITMFMQMNGGSSESAAKNGSVP